jgi:hypothetical protein
MYKPSIPQSAASTPLLSSAGLYFRQGLHGERFHQVANLVNGLRYALAFEISAHFFKHGVTTWIVDLRHHKSSCISLSIRPNEAEFPRRPKTQEAVPPRIGPESQRLILSKFRLERSLTLVKGGHGDLLLSAIADWRVKEQASIDPPNLAMQPSKR